MSEHEVCVFSTVGVGSSECPLLSPRGTVFGAILFPLIQMISVTTVLQVAFPGVNMQLPSALQVAITKQTSVADLNSGLSAL